VLSPGRKDRLAISAGQATVRHAGNRGQCLPVRARDSYKQLIPYLLAALPSQQYLLRAGAAGYLWLGTHIRQQRCCVWAEMDDLHARFWRGLWKPPC
jgi:hypothetical protein